MYIISDGIIALRSFNYNDLDDFYEFSSQKELGFNAGWRPHTSKEMSLKILNVKCLDSNSMAIVLLSENKVIGSLEFYKSHIRPTINSYEMGFVINKDYWGLGYAKRADNLGLKYAFSKKNYLEVSPIMIEACHIDNNIRCEHTLLSLGFSYEGTLKSYKKLYDNRIVDVKLYRIFKTDFERIER